MLLIRSNYNFGCPAIDKTLHTMTETGSIGNIPRPRSTAEIILDLLSCVPAHELPASELRKACALFDVSEQNMRVALTRLRAQGKLISPSRGRYALKTRHNGLFREVSQWRQREDRVLSWQGRWIGVLDAAVPRTDRTLLRRHARALDLRGFRLFRPGLHLRPDNLAGGVQGLRNELMSLGMAADCVVFGVCDLMPEEQRQSIELWDTESLREGYRHMLSRLDTSEKRLDAMTIAEAGVESLLLGRSIIREILRDPLLPEELLPSADRLKVLRQMRQYQMHAEEIWNQLLKLG